MQVNKISLYTNQNKTNSNTCFGAKVRVSTDINIPDNIKTMEELKSYLKDKTLLNLSDVLANKLGIKSDVKHNVNTNNVKAVINNDGPSKVKPWNIDMTELQWQCFQGNTEIVKKYA